MALGFGLLPSQVSEIGASDYDLLTRYWKAEPWGPWRDNMHAAVIAREIRRPWINDQSKNLLSDFLLIDPDQRQQQSAAGFIQLFKTIAKKRKRKN